MNGLRKFTMAMSFGFSCFFLCYTGHMSGGETVTVVSILAGMYKVANVYDKIKGGAG